MRTAFIPAVFSHGNEDNFIRPHHSLRLHDACSSVDKRLVMFDGTHNSQRPEYFYTCVGQFFHQSLRLDEMIVNQVEVSPSLPPGIGDAVRHVSSILSSQHEVRQRGGPAWVGRSVGDSKGNPDSSKVSDEPEALMNSSSGLLEGDCSAANLNSEQAMQSIRRWGESARMEMQTQRGILAELMGGGGGSFQFESEGTGVNAAASGVPPQVLQDEDDELTKKMIAEAIRLSLQEGQETKAQES